MDDVKFYVGRLDKSWYLCQLFLFSCNKNFDKPFWVPSAGKKCLTIKSTGIAVDENDSIVSLHK